MAKINSINNKSGALEIDPGASGDSFMQFDINTTGEFRIGVDDTDDSFRISQGSSLGTNDTFIMTDAGERTMPLQPAVAAYPSSQPSNVSGDGTYYTLICATEIYDQGSDFDGTSTFIAPVTGRYLIEGRATLNIDVISGGNEMRVRIVTSNRSYDGGFLPTEVRVALFYGANGFTTVVKQAFCDMDASDTATIQFMSANGSKLDDLRIGNYYNGITAVLIC